MELTKEYFDEVIGGLASKKELAGLATKEDLKVFAKKEDLIGLVTKEDLHGFAMKEDLEVFATKEDLGGLATKEDLDTTKLEMRNGFEAVDKRFEAQTTELKVYVDKVVREVVTEVVTDSIDSLARDVLKPSFEHLESRLDVVEVAVRLRV